MIKLLIVEQDCKTGNGNSIKIWASDASNFDRLPKEAVKAVFKAIKGKITLSNFETLSEREVSFDYSRDDRIAYIDRIEGVANSVLFNNDGRKIEKSN